MSSSPSSSADKCPVDHSTRSAWAGVAPSGAACSSSSSPPTPPPSPSSLSKDREVSSIPRADGEKWVYPSQAQFYAAMARKQYDPQESDMKVIVPIHNAVNERAWGEVMSWEAGQGGDKCGGVKLVSFQGRPGDLSPRARWKTLLGYQAPFDRHDWVVERCGTRIRYIIDFYTGRGTETNSNNLSFYLDVRPAYDNWEGVRMRFGRFWSGWFGGVSNNAPGPSSSPPPPSKSAPHRTS